MHRIRPVLVSVIILLLSSLSVHSQIELVPPEHHVYAFLKRLQVRGVLIDQYTSSSLPYDRRTVASLLAHASERSDRMSRAERAMLQRYMVEFSYELGLPREERISITHMGLSDMLNPRQKYFYRFEDTTAVLSATVFLSGEMQQWNLQTIPERNTSLWQIGGGVSGTLGGWFGFSLHARNGYVAGSRKLGIQNIEVRRTYKIEEPDSRFFDTTRGHVRIANDWGSVVIGRERLIQGNGLHRNTLLFSDYAPKVDFVGINLNYKRFFFNFHHGWILSEETLVTGPDGITRRHIPDKYVTFHRFGSYFFDARLQVAVSEVIIYGDRGLEIAYLNPFLFFKSVEHSLRDRDKAMIAFDFQFRPFGGVEFYGDLLIDDLSIGKLGTNWYGNQYGFRLGGMLTPTFVGLPDALVSVDYVRIQPYVYTHRLPINRYTHGGYPLGNPTGPNSDMLDIRWDQLWSGRASTLIYTQRVRKGHNVLDEEGNLLRNVGGNIAQGHRPGDNVEVWFLDGNLEKINIFGISVRYEIFHQFYLSAGYEFREREKTWLGQTFHEHFMFGKLVIEL